MKMGILYEVNLFVERKIESDCREWLLKHIAQILALLDFFDAKSFDVEQNDSADVVAITV